MSKPNLHNVESEKALIGAAIIAGPEVLDYRAVSYIRPAHFYDQRHQLIWKTLLEMRENGTEINVLTVENALNWSDVDSAYISQLMYACPSYIQADSYANIIIDHAKRRFAEMAISRLGSAVYGNGHFAPALEDAIGILERIKDGGPGSILPWEVFTLHDAYKPRDPLVYVVQGLFCLPSLNVVYGVPGCLKSMLLADMALCVAAGIPWLKPPPGHDDVLPRLTENTPVLWLDFDNGTRRTHERIDALGKSRDISATEALFYYVSMPSPWLCADNAGSVRALAGLVRERNAGMVVIDNLGTVSGDADENSADMVQVFANLRRLSETTESAVVVVHHQRKGTGFKARDGESLRGHSSIEGALDLALLVERKDNSPNVTVKSTKTRGVDVAPFGATFAYTHREGTKELEGAQFFGVPVYDDRRPSRAERAILQVVSEADDPPQKMELIRAAQKIEDDIGVNYFRDMITALVQTGKIVERDTGRKNARVYSLE